MLPPPSSSSTVNCHVRYRCDGIRFCRPHCCQLKTTLSLPLTNRSVCDPRQRPRTSWWSPLLLPPYTHMVRGLLFLWRRIFLVAHTPTSWWEEGMEASSWQEIWRWSSCQFKHVPDFPSIILASMPWWRWKYVVAVVNFLVFTSYHLSLFCINLQKYSVLHVCCSVLVGACDGYLLVCVAPFLLINIWTSKVVYVDGG